MQCPSCLNPTLTKISTLSKLKDHPTLKGKTRFELQKMHKAGYRFLTCTECHATVGPRILPVKEV